MPLSISRKQLQPLIYLKEFLLNIMFLIAYNVIVLTTQRFGSMYFQNVLSEWNLLDTNIKESNMLEAFKSKLLGGIRPIEIQCTIFIT